MSSTIGAYQPTSTIGAYQVSSTVEYGVNAILPALGIFTPDHPEVNATLPDIQITATAREEHYLNTDPRDGFNPKLPNLKLSARTNEIGSLDERLPDLRLSSRFGSSISADLPWLEITGNVSEIVHGNVDKYLPELKIVSLVASRTGTLNLPYISIDGEIIYGDGTTSLDKNLPTLIMSSLASGDDYGGSESTMVNKSRFSGDLLRYDRWAS